MSRTDQDVLQEGRKHALEGVEVPLRERSLQKLVKKLEELEEGQNTVKMWNQANTDRTEHLRKQRLLLDEWDEFIRPIYGKAQEWMSDLHLPIAFTICKTLHARFLSALFSIDPPFVMKARQAAFEDKTQVVYDVMRYTVKNWVNHYKGIEEVYDQHIWAWLTGGSSVMKQRWERQFERFLDVVERPVQVGTIDTIDPQTGESIMLPQMEMQEVEEEVTEVIFDGPIFERVPEEDIVFIGGDEDVDGCDSIIQQVQMTASDLWSLADQGIFRENIVEEVIRGGDNPVSGKPQNMIKQEQHEGHGLANLDKDYDLQRYTILERYAKIDVDGSGINTQVIMWVHEETSKILRATYLRRVNKSGLRPYSKINFHQRSTKKYPVGVPELIYSLTKEIDALENIKIDIGIQTSLPLGFYRPSSSTNEEIISYGPGQLIPLDNPQADIYFPNFGNRTFFSSSEQQFLMSQIERIVSLGDLNYGLTTSQGAARTATGARSLITESSSNLDVYLKRLNRGFDRDLKFLFHSLQEKLPAGFEFRVFGDDGQSYFRRIESKQELCGMYDFELEPNSAASNKQIQVEIANQKLQLTSNPLDYQLGVITPLERYEALKDWYIVNGVRDYGKYVRKPTAPVRIFTPLEMANRVLAGTDQPWTPEQDIQGFIDWFDQVMKTDELLGMFDQDQTVLLFKKYQDAKAMAQAIAAQQAQFANQQQVAMNAAMSTGAAQPVPAGNTPNNPAAGQ